MRRTTSARSPGGQVLVVGPRTRVFTASFAMLLESYGLHTTVVEHTDELSVKGEASAVVFCEGTSSDAAGQIVDALRGVRPDVVVVGLPGVEVEGADVTLKPTAEVDDLLRLLPVRTTGTGNTVSIRRTRHRSHGGALGRLTDRELQLYLLLADGKSNEAIAEKLDISPHTVRTHVQNILGKLGVRSRLEAAGLASAYLGYRLKAESAGAA